MDREESIYDLIPKEYVPPPKPKRYHSKFPPTTNPTASTFCLRTSSKILSNLQGDYDFFPGPHLSKSLSATFGQFKGAVKPDPASFVKKGTGTIKLPEVKRFMRSGEHKAPVSTRDERPIMGLRTEKNFVVANAVDVILKAPKKLPEPEDPLKRKSYGQVPPYLAKIKQDLDSEYETMQQLHREAEAESDKQRYLLPSEEVQELIDGLKRKWEAVNREYQKSTHVVKVDTQGQKRRKEGCEAQLAQIEKDIQTLSKPYVFVDATT